MFTKTDTFILGMCVGTAYTGLWAALTLRRWVVVDQKFKAKQRANLEHLIQAWSPHVPVEIMRAELEYLKFDDIITNEGF